MYLGQIAYNYVDFFVLAVMKHHSIFNFREYLGRQLKNEQQQGQSAIRAN